MRTSVQLMLAGMCAFTLVACGSGSDPVGSAEAGLVEPFPHHRGVCGPEDKADEEGDQKDLCDGAPAEVICVKAGTMCFCATESGTYNDCYVFDLEAGDVTRIGEGRDCKGISNTQYTCGEPPKCPPDVSECSVDSDCPKDEVCGKDGCCEPAPKCPPDVSECSVDSDCPKDEVCGEDGCCEPEPPACDIPCDDKGGCPDKLMCDSGCCV